MIATNLAMDNQRLQELLREIGCVVHESPDCWSVQYDGRKLLVITDQEQDRMRVMVPVVEDHVLDASELRVLMAANFDRALDARYAIAGGYLWSVFMHPLHNLTDSFVLDAVAQVKALAENFRRSFSSSDLQFTGGSY